MKNLLALFFAFSLAFSQNDALRISDWKNYTSLLSINSLSSQGEVIWGATNGGVFSYNSSTKSLMKFSSVEGLSNLELSSIMADTKNRIWIGGLGGTVDVYFTQTKEWLNIKDISAAYSGLSKKINCFLQKNDSIYIASDFGISIYDISIREFRDTYVKLGTFAAFSPVIDLCFSSNEVFALTQNGIAVADKNNKNLISPDAWSSFPKTIHFENQNLIDIEVRNNTLYILTEFGLFKKTGNSVSKIQSFEEPSKKLALAGDKIYIALQNKIFSLNLNDQVESASIISQNNLTNAHFGNNSLWVSTVNNGLSVIKNNALETIDLNCPYSSSFSSVIIHSDGSLWAASSGFGENNNPYGFYRFYESKWTNYNKSKNPELLSNAACSIAEGNDGSVFVGTYGGGLYNIKGDKITFYNSNNSSIIQAPGDNPNFIVITGIAKDLSGNLWFTNYIALNNNALHALSSTGSWKGYQNGINPASIFYFRGLVVDEYGTKWIISDYDPIYDGIFYFNEKYTLPGTVGGWGYLSNNDVYSGGGNYQVLCLAIDKNNELWIGTESGVSVIGKISNPLASISKPCVTTRCNISGQIINCIAVDPLNNKWVGTRATGIWVLSPDGSSVITQLNTENSFLTDNNIKSITMDPKSGYVYVGTDRGLSSFKTFLVEPLPEFSEKLKIYPNPYDPEKGSLSIDGLIEASLIKVITPYGKMIKSFESPGGKVAYWDGKDDNNNFVASGVYFVIGYSSDGKKNSIGKVAVVRAGK